MRRSVASQAESRSGIGVARAPGDISFAIQQRARHGGGHLPSWLSKHGE